MVLLVVFAFVAGVVTILSPCILPVLPIVLAGSTTGGRRRPFGIIVGFVGGFTLFTLFLTALLKILNVPSDTLRTLSIVVVFVFGISLFVPGFDKFTEKLFSYFGKFAPTPNGSEGFMGGVFLGLSLGLLWAPCVGPILASVIALAATSVVTLQTFLITLFYSIGTAIPMFGILISGRRISNSPKVQKFFGVVMVVTAVGMFFNLDRNFQTFILNKFPGYGAGLTQIEQNPAVQNELNSLRTSQASVNMGPAPQFVVGGRWFNSQPLSMKELKGKVILVDFWTYTCINCIRTLPHLVDWYQKYKDSGLVIVGVHTPEFAFEQEENNVAKAISSFGIKYPVMQDNNYATWNLYNNNYWPAEYLIDKKGNIRHTHFGEGEYEQTEMTIQSLLKESGGSVSAALSTLKDETPKGVLSPETYINALRMQYYYPTQNTGLVNKVFTISPNLPLHSFSLGGIWNIGNENSTAGEAAVLSYHFFANKVFLVMKPGSAKNSSVKVFLDDKDNGTVIVDSDRLYTLVDLDGNASSHTLKLQFTPGIEVFAFTFG